VALQQPGKKIESRAGSQWISALIERAAVAGYAICKLRGRRWHDGMESPF